MLTPRIESVIAERKGEVILAKVDIDENTDLALDYDVSLTFCINIYFEIGLKIILIVSSFSF